MKKIKKLLALVLVIALVGAAVGGTLAYLQDTDSDVNVMTLGNVYIKQHEYQRAEGIEYNAGEAGAGNGVKEGDLVPFVQGQKLYPAVPKNGAASDYTAEETDLFFWGDYVYSGTAGNGLWNDNKLSNVMDKMVFVENTGKSDAYFRTIFAFECPEGMEYSQGSDKEFMMNKNGSAIYNWEDVGYITVDGVRYYVREATYQKPLAPGNQAQPSLLQVVMTHNATNEDMELLGDTYEILVLSQAVQTEGFADAQTALDTAFGKPSEKAAEWFGGEEFEVPAVVATADELNRALANGESVVLAGNVDYGTVTVGELSNVSIKGAEGATMIFKTDANTKINNVTVSDVEFKYTGATVDCGVVIDANASINNLVIENCTFTGTGAKAGRGLSGLNNSASIVIKNSTFKDLGYPIYAWGGYESLTIEGCTFDNIKSWAVMPQSGFDGDLTVNGCTFVNCLGGGLIKAGTLTAGHTFTFTDNTITGCTIAGDHNWFQFNVSAGTSVISGNTKDGVEWTPSTTDGLK